jgi:hypothetical protein
MKCYLPGRVQIQSLEFINLSGEISALSSDHILRVLDKFNPLDRIIAFLADNNNCNFGDAQWRRKNNVFTNLQDSAK